MDQTIDSSKKITNKTKNKAGAKYQNKILVLLLLFALAVVAISAFLYTKDIKAKKRIEKFYGIEKALKEKENVKISQVEEFITQYNNSSQAELARYYTALYYLSLKDYTKAEEWLLLTNIEEQNTVSILARLALANTYQQKKEYQKANSILQSIDIPSLSDYLLIEIIQNNILDNKTAEAKSLLNIFLRDYKNSRLRSIAEEILRLIN